MMTLAPKETLAHAGPKRGGGFERAARHQRLGGQREIVLALDGDEVAHLPAEAEPRHLRVAVAVEVRMEAAERQHELAGMRAAEPHDVGEAAGEPHRFMQEPGILRQLRLHPHHAVARGEARDEADLDRDERHLRTRQRHATEAEDRQLEAAAERDRDDGDAVDEREAREAQAGGEPEAVAPHREGVAHGDQRLHRVGGAEAEASSAEIITKSPKVLRLDGKIRSRLMPKPPPMPVTKKAGGPPIGPVTAPKAKKAVNRVPSLTPVP